MKAFKRTACALLAVFMLAGLPSCAASAKPFEHDKMTDFCGKMDFEECSEPDEFFDAYTRMTAGIMDEEGAYITASGSDAADVYNLFMNRFTDMPSYDVDESTVFAFSGDDGFFMGFVFTFESSKEAGKFYKRFARKFIDDGKETEEKGCTYALSANWETDDQAILYGVYLKDDTVLIVRGICSDTGLADGLCKTYGVKSPSGEL